MATADAGTPGSIGAMPDVVIIDAVRTPVGRRNGRLSHGSPRRPARDGPDRAPGAHRHRPRPGGPGRRPAACPRSASSRSTSPAPRGWRPACRSPTPATTVDTQCGSSQQATNLAASLVGVGRRSTWPWPAGVESMSRIPIGSNSVQEARPRGPDPEDLLRPLRVHLAVRGGGAHRRARWGITRADTDAFGLRSQQLAAQAWAEGRFDTPDRPGRRAPVLDEDGKPTGETATVQRDEGLRDTTAEALAEPQAGGPTRRRAHRRHVLADLRRRGRPAAHDPGAGRPSSASRPEARITHQCLVGVDPVLMLTGPIDATNALLERTGLGIGDIDLFEINEAFASVVLAWEKEVKPDPDTVNPNGGAIALGHPLGGTGVVLLTKALHELERTGGRRALVSMCCGGGLGTGTLIER